MNKARGVGLVLLVSLFAYANPTPSPPSDASATKRGLVNTTSQTFSGLKTFEDGGIIATLRTGSTFEGSPILIGLSDGGSSFLSSTNATVSLFVDPTGSDTGSCTDGGVFACATVTGAWDKIPNVIADNVTVTIANGTYTGFTLGNRTLSHRSSAAPSITFTGSKITHTPTTGPSSGTLTGVSGTPATTGTATLTDSTATWTVSDTALDGRFVRITSGAASGQVRAIVGNTATTLTVFPAYSPAPVAADGYVIETPGAIFGASSVLPMPGAASFIFNNMDFTSASSTAAFASTGALYQTVSIRGSRGINSSSGVGIGAVSITGSGGANTGPVIGLAASGSGIATSQNASFVGGAYGRSITGSGAILVSTSLTGTGSSWLNVYGRTSGATNAVSATLNSVTSSGAGAAVIYADCTSAASSTGVRILGAGGQVTINAFAANCTNGFVLGPEFTFQAIAGQFAPNVLNCNSVTTCLTLSRGLRAKIPVPTLTSVTNDYSVDGVFYSEATFSSFSPVRIIGANLSVLER